MKAWAWIVQAAKDVYSFVYTEAGTALKLLKDPAGKFSHKRILALGFGVMAIYLILKPRGWMDVLVAGAFAVSAVVISWVSAATKT